MSGNRSCLRAMRLLPFAAAVVWLTLNRQSVMGGAEMACLEDKASVHYKRARFKPKGHVPGNGFLSLFCQ